MKDEINAFKFALNDYRRRRRLYRSRKTARKVLRIIGLVLFLLLILWLIHDTIKFIMEYV